MNESLAEYLTHHRVSTDTLLQAARFYLAEQTGDLPIEEMRRQMVAAVGDAARVDTVARQTARDPLALENAAHFLLSAAWEQPGGKEWIAGALEDADKSLPVLEVGVLSIAMMYIAYLAVTSGIREEETTEERRADGSFKKTTKREFFGPSGPLSAIVQLFQTTGGDGGD